MEQLVMDSKKINRNEKFCTNVKNKDVKCVLSGTDTVQCESAHIVPLNGLYGQNNFKNPEILNDSANGMLLSKEFHILYDKFIWGINPNNYEEIDGISRMRKYNIQIVDKYKEKILSINKYKHIILRAECHHFIEVAYNIFISTWNPPEQSYKKLEILSNSELYKTKEKHDNYTTIVKLSQQERDELDNELSQFIIQRDDKRKQVFNKKKKIALGLHFNLHEQSIESYYKQLKLEFNKRIK